MARRPQYPSDLTDTQWAVIEPLLPPVRLLVTAVTLLVAWPYGWGGYYAVN